MTKLDPATPLDRRCLPGNQVARQRAEKRHQDSAPARRKDTPGQRASTQERGIFLRAGALLPFARAGALFLVPLETLYNLLKDAGAARQHAGKRHQDSAPA